MTYIVRSNWLDTKTQQGKYEKLENAKAVCDKDPQWYVFEEKGTLIYPKFTNAYEKLEQACKWAEAISKSPLHGYDATYTNNKRWGSKGDYTCSTLIYTAFKYAGIVDFKALKLSATKDLPAVAVKNGFTDVTKQVKLNNASGMKRGDILVSKNEEHSALYLGSGKLVQATCNEKGTGTGGTPGDQTGGEIAIGKYYNFPWKCVLRLNGADKKPTYRVQSGRYIYKANADKMVEKVKKAGFDVLLVQEGAEYIVQLGLFTVKQNALNLEAKVKAAKLPVLVLEI